jgi:iron-sulfur cluster insertion protein
MKNQITALADPVIITQDCVDKVHGLLVDEDNFDLHLRVFIKGGGCSGFTYGFMFDEERREDDIAVEKFNTAEPDQQQAVTLLIDALSIQYLKGATIDYREDVNGARFVISNPNAKTTCGCGSSFSVDEQDD